MHNNNNTTEAQHLPPTSPQHAGLKSEADKSEVHRLAKDEERRQKALLGNAPKLKTKKQLKELKERRRLRDMRAAEAAMSHAERVRAKRVDWVAKSQVRSGLDSTSWALLCLLTSHPLPSHPLTSCPLISHPLTSPSLTSLSLTSPQLASPPLASPSPLPSAWYRGSRRDAPGARSRAHGD